MEEQPLEFPPDSWDGYARREFRLPGFGGAGVFLRSQLVPTPSAKDGAELAFDLGILSPDRFVQYLARVAEPDFAGRLAEFFLRAASEFHPEKSLATFTDGRMGLTVSAVSSTDQRVGLEVTILQDLSAQVLEPDGMDFETSRGVLVTASHDVRNLGGRRDPISLETEMWP